MPFKKYNGHIGCAKVILKHRSAKAKTIKRQSSLKMICFTEDKAIVDKKINKFLDYFGSDWDIIQLTACYKSLSDIDTEDIKKVDRNYFF